MNPILKLLILGLIFVGVYVVGKPYFNLAFIQENQVYLKQYYSLYPWRTYVMFLGTFLLFTVTGAPVIALFTMLAGFLFGAIKGVLIIVISFALHCLLSIVFARYVFKEIIKKYVEKKIAVLNKRIEKQGLYYLFVLRVSLITPSVLINYACAFTSMKVIPFVCVSVVASLPILTIIVFSGELIGEINTIWELYNPINL